MLLVDTFKNYGPCKGVLSPGPVFYPLRWRHNGRDSVSNHQPHDSWFTQPFIQMQIKENIKAPRHWPLCWEFTVDRWIPAQMASNAGNVSIWWRHHVWLSTILTNERRSAICNVFSHWLRPLQAIGRTWAQIYYRHTWFLILECFTYNTS